MKSRYKGSKHAQITTGQLTRIQVLAVTLFFSALKDTYYSRDRKEFLLNIAAKLPLSYSRQPF